MNKIVSSFLDEFAKEYGFETLEIDKQFEHFSNFCVFSNEFGMLSMDIKDAYTGEDTQGVDGIVVEVNGKIIENNDDINTLIKTNNRLEVTFVLIQSKTSDSFNNQEMLNFFSFAKVFFSDTARDTFATDEMLNFIDIKDEIYSNARYFTQRNPKLKLYFVTTGTWNDSDVSLKAVRNQNIKDFKELNLFASVEFMPCGTNEIMQMYRKSKEQIEATFIFDKKVIMFDDEKGEYGFSGVIPYKEFKKIICNQNGSLKNVFEDNIRDFLGPNNDVNCGIETTIKSGSMSRFCMLNNGVTIVARTSSNTGSSITIKDYQIVNGCQTSHILFEYCTSKDDLEILIPIKLIVTSDEELKSAITKATNSQTGIKTEQLEALSTYQKTLEEYFLSYKKPDERLFYERRVGQYSGQALNKDRIISIRMQIKNYASMFLDKPHDAAGHYGLLLKDVGNKIFISSDQQIAYYTASYALYRFQQLLKVKLIDKKFGKGKYHAIMLLKYLVVGTFPKQMNSKKAQKACDSILTVLNDSDQCLVAFKKVVDYIEKQELVDLGDRKVFEKKETTECLITNIKELQ